MVPVPGNLQLVLEFEAGIGIKSGQPIAIVIRGLQEELRPNAAEYEKLYHWFIIAREVKITKQEVLAITDNGECARS